MQGDGASSNPSSVLSADPNLQACIAAAERAVSAQRPASAAASADPRQSGDDDAEPDSSAWPNAESDSDGGVDTSPRICYVTAAFIFFMNTKHNNHVFLPTGKRS